MKSARIAVIGCGAVASVHVRRLGGLRHPESVVFGPDAREAEAFAGLHGFRHWTSDMGEAVSCAELALICSPTEYHFAQACFCLRAGIPTLVELPPSQTPEEAEELGALSARTGVPLQCAHTSRYIESYRIIGAALESGTLGGVRQVSYLRAQMHHPRSWRDDPVLHHAAHPLDLLLHWFGDLEAAGRVSLPPPEDACSVSLLARLPNGAPAGISICDRSELPLHRMAIVGADHTVESSGFHRVHSDLPHLAFAGDENSVYEDAIGEQDRAFLGFCQGAVSAIPWAETTRLMRKIQEFRLLPEGARSPASAAPRPTAVAPNGLSGR